MLLPVPSQVHPDIEKPVRPGESKLFFCSIKKGSNPAIVVGCKPTTDRLVRQWSRLPDHRLRWPLGCMLGVLPCIVVSLFSTSSRWGAWGSRVVCGARVKDGDE